MIRTVAETGSTNDDVAALAKAGAPEGLWLRAERQSGGRGRHGRSWHSPAGNLYASTLVRLHPGDPPAPTLALVVAVALGLAVFVGDRGDDSTPRRGSQPAPQEQPVAPPGGEVEHGR